MKIPEACKIIDKQLVKKDELGFVVRPGELEFREITAGVPEGTRLVAPMMGLSPFSFAIILSTTRETYVSLLIKETGARIVRVVHKDRERYDGSIDGIWYASLEYSAKVLCTALYNKNKLTRLKDFARLTRV